MGGSGSSVRVRLHRKSRLAARTPEGQTVTARWFLALDGDDIGRRLELYMLTENLDELRKFSSAFSSIVAKLTDHLSASPSVDIILGSGDSILVALPAEEISKAVGLVERLTSETGFTFSGGYGTSMREAYIALKIAKSTGKNRILSGALDKSRAT